MSIFDISMEDIEKKIKNTNRKKKEIFREFIKKENDFICTDNFFLSEETDNDYINFEQIQGQHNINTIDKINNEYIIFYKIEYNFDSIKKESEKVNLIILKDTQFDYDIKKMNAKKLIQENILSLEESTKILEEIYYNESYSSQIQLESPKKNKDFTLFKLNVSFLSRPSYKKLTTFSLLFIFLKKSPNFDIKYFLLTG